MSVGRKRVRGIRPQHAVSRVARCALADRFDAVHFFLPRAAKRPSEDTEYVHQLRIATRRGLAALELFSGLVPPRRARAVERDLKRLRRAAGAARDLDVLAEWIRKEVSDQALADPQAVIDAIARHRREAQVSIVKAHQSCRHTRFRRRARTLIDKTRWRCKLPEPRIGKAAAAMVCLPVSSFFVAATADLSDIAALHEMRIQGKQLRYALELLTPAFQRPQRKDLFAAFAQLQTRLGDINDLATAKTLFEQWLGPVATLDSNRLLGGWLVTIEKNLEQRRGEFLAWWTLERTADLRRRFDRMLVG